MKFKDIELNIEELKEEIRSSSKETAIYVGSDSVRFFETERGEKVRYSAYVTVVVIHKDGKHGASVFKKVEVQRDFGSLRQRLMTEVYSAVTVASELVEDIGERPFEVHLDVNPDKNHKSSIVVKEALGYVKGVLGVDAKVKPEAFAAQAVADRYTQ